MYNLEVKRLHALISEKEEELKEKEENITVIKPEIRYKEYNEHTFVCERRIDMLKFSQLDENNKDTIKMSIMRQLWNDIFDEVYKAKAIMLIEEIPNPLDFTLKFAMKVVLKERR